MITLSEKNPGWHLILDKGKDVGLIFYRRRRNAFAACVYPVKFTEEIWLEEDFSTLEAAFDAAKEKLFELTRRM